MESKTVVNLWVKIGNRCLELADDLLNRKTALTGEEVRTARELVEMAIQLDSQCLKQEVGNRSCLQAYSGPLFARSSAEY